MLLPRGHAPIEEHDGARVVQLVHLYPCKRTAQWLERSTHLVEVGDVRDVNEVNNRKVLHLLRNRVESLIHGHALAVPVMAEANNNDPVFLGFDSLVDVPTRGKVGEKIRHRC